MHRDCFKHSLTSWLPVLSDYYTVRKKMGFTTPPPYDPASFLPTTSPCPYTAASPATQDGTEYRLSQNIWGSSIFLLSGSREVGLGLRSKLLWDLRMTNVIMERNAIISRYGGLWEAVPSSRQYWSYYPQLCLSQVYSTEFWRHWLFAASDLLACIMGVLLKVSVWSVYRLTRVNREISAFIPWEKGAGGGVGGGGGGGGVKKRVFWGMLNL